jgi:hypothetical protein
MNFKSGVDPRYLSAPAWHGLWIADKEYQLQTDEEATCTSTGESKHSKERSRHYTGAYGFGYSHAFDLRIWVFVDEDETTNFALGLKSSLGEDYVVVVESDHIHVHWSPVYHEE